MPITIPVSPRARWGTRLALIGYAGLLATSILTPGRAGVPGAGVFDLRTGARIRDVLLAIALYALLEVARFVPLGALATRAVLGTRGGFVRMMIAIVAAGLGSLIIGAIVLTLEIGRPWPRPGPSDLLLPAVGCCLGIAASLVWAAGRRIRQLVLLSLCAALVTVPILLGGALFALAEREPLVGGSPAVTSEDKRRLYYLLRHKNPKRIEPGDTRTISLESRDVDLLLAWWLPVVLGDGRGRARVDLLSPQDATMSLTLRLPAPWISPRYLNVVAGTQARIGSDGLDLAALRLRVGRLVMSERSLRWICPVLTAAIHAERRLRPVLAGVQSLEIGSGRVTLVYGRMDLPPGLLAGLIWGEGSNEVLRVSVRSNVERLLDSGPRLPAGERRLGATVELAFAVASERSGASPPVLENRAALLALGILLGHSRLEQFVGQVMDKEDWHRASPFARVALRGRNDWARHFFVSAAITVLSTQAPSDAIGLFKEELDAGGGSGFSFADLMADRAGTTFALLATRDDVAARALQQRLATGFRVDDFFPEASDLPENIQDKELKVRYGGLEGPLFRHYAAEVERRLWRCPAYRSLSPTSPGVSIDATGKASAAARTTWSPINRADQVPIGPEPTAAFHASR